MNDLHTLFEGFTIHLEAAGRRPTTVQWYAKHARRFFAWLEREGMSATLDEISTLRIRKFMAYLQSGVQAWESNPYVPTQERGLSSSYVVGSVRTLRAWFNWMQDEGYLDDNPMDRVKTPKQQQRLIEPLETCEIKRLLKAIDGTSFTAYRNRAIVLTLLDCGLRIGELCQLDIDDIDLKAGWVRVRHGKGWKERKVPIGGTLRRALWQYNVVRPEPMGGTAGSSSPPPAGPWRPSVCARCWFARAKKQASITCTPIDFATPLPCIFCAMEATPSPYACSWATRPFRWSAVMSS